MLRSLYSGVSGLQNHQTRMDVIGNNVSNVNTTGFKKGRVTFEDMPLQQRLSYSPRFTATNVTLSCLPKQYAVICHIYPPTTRETQNNAPITTYELQPCNCKLNSALT